MNSFNSVDDFITFIDGFNYNEYSTIALPILLKETIFGMVFALACNFLKDLGYDEYAKHDYMLRIFLLD